MRIKVISAKMDLTASLMIESLNIHALLYKCAASNKKLKSLELAMNTEEKSAQETAGHQLMVYAA